MQRIDGELWDRMQQLTAAGLQGTLGAWVGEREIRALIERRDRMQQAIAKMVAKSGESAVFLR